MDSCCSAEEEGLKDSFKEVSEDTHVYKVRLTTAR